MNTPLPLNAADFAQLLKPFDLDKGLTALAVSGGPDSMAMAWGACAALGANKVCAFIVDHALREESAQEAQKVKEQLTAMGIETEILRWQHDAVNSRIHVQARDARYELLLKACQKRGATNLLLAHHQGDQAETILMRFSKGSGMIGLAGMKPETKREDIRILRPFLNIDKTQLIATCQTQNISFVTDPSNNSQNYARGRLRRVKEALATEGLTDERLLDLGARASEASSAIDHYTRLFIRQEALPTFGGAIELNSQPLSNIPRATSLHALSLLVQAIHKKTYPPERISLMRVLDFLCDTTQEGAITLQGCLMQKRKDTILFLREPAAIKDIRPIAPQESLIWDDRWRVHYSGDETGLEVRPLGFQPRAVLKQLSPDFRHLVPQGRVRVGVPALWLGDRLKALPAFSCDFGGLFGSEEELTNLTNLP